MLDRNLFTRYLSGLELPSRIKLTCNQLSLQHSPTPVPSPRVPRYFHACLSLAPLPISPSFSKLFVLFLSLPRFLSSFRTLSTTLFYARISITVEFSTFSRSPELIRPDAYNGAIRANDLRRSLPPIYLSIVHHRHGASVYDCYLT